MILKIISIGALGATLVYASCVSLGQTTEKNGSQNELSKGNSYSKVYNPAIRLCGGGFTILPVEFKDQYQAHLSKIKADSILLKHDVPFYGFTYCLDDDSLTDGPRSVCSDIVSLRPDGIEFINSELNEVIKAYISAEMSNELELARASTEVSLGLAQPREVSLCIAASCGESSSSSGAQSFKFTDMPDVGYARDFSNGMLTIETLNELRRICQSEDSVQKIGDEALWGLLRQARQIAISQAK